MAMMRKRGFRRKPKKRYTWTGLQVLGQALPVSPGTLILSLVGGAGGGADIFRGSDLLVERTIFDINWDNTDEGQVLLGAYLATFPVEIAAQVPQGTWSPLTTDPDAFEKRVMWYRQFFLDPGEGGTGQSIALRDPFDIPVKRKLRGDEALVLVLEQSNTVIAPVNVTVLARVLLSLGRR